MYSDPVVESASKLPLDLGNWNNFVSALRSTYPNLPKNYAWMKIYADVVPDKFIAEWVSDVAIHYSDRNLVKASILGVLLLLGVSLSVAANESIAEVLQHIAEVAS